MLSFAANIKEQCSSHVVQGELLPKIDDDIDTALGLTAFYQYVRTAALNQRQTQHGYYQRCLQLSTQNVHTLLYAVRMPDIATFPEFIQLLDDDIV